MKNVPISQAASFDQFEIHPTVLRALGAVSIHHPTAIQEQVIPPILAGRDVVGKAETGTGKTIGFCAPTLGKLDVQRVSVQCLVLTPTRELAQQVAGVFDQLGEDVGVRVALIVGGVHASEQIEKLRTGCQVVVGTPGRVLEFLEDRILSLAWCETVVLDEADRMLDMGFIEDVSKILDRTPPERQTLLFSATLPPEVKRLLHRYMRDPLICSTNEGVSTAREIEQRYIEAESPRKFRVLAKLLDETPEETAIIFTNTRRQAIDLDRMLWGHGYSAGALHGDQDQETRFRILEGFRRGEIRVLVATDVASRGLDIEKVGKVINYEIPRDVESYVHRIGRTGRAKTRGVAISLVSARERRAWQDILRRSDSPIERMNSPGRRDARDNTADRERGGRRRGERRGDGRSTRGREARDPRERVRRSSGSSDEEGFEGSGGESASRTRTEAPEAMEADSDSGSRRPRRRRRRGESVAESKSPPSGSAAAPVEGGEPVAREVSGERRGSRQDSGDPDLPGRGRRSSAPRGERSGRRKPAKPVEFTNEERELLKRRPRERPEKRKLEELDESYFATDYFSVDPDSTSPAEERPSSARKDRQSERSEGASRRNGRERRGERDERTEAGGEPSSRRRRSHRDDDAADARSGESEERPDERRGGGSRRPRRHRTEGATRASGTSAPRERPPVREEAAPAEETRSGSSSRRRRRSRSRQNGPN